MVQTIINVSIFIGFQVRQVFKYDAFMGTNYFLQNCSSFRFMSAPLQKKGVAPSEMETMDPFCRLVGADD